MPELVCPIHGPYDANYGTCPYCSGQFDQPPSPAPLGSADDLPTDLGAGSAPQGGYGMGYSDDDPTDLGYARRGGGQAYMDEDEDPTELGYGSRREMDVTEVDFEDTSAMAILWVKEGSRRGHIYKVKEGTRVGRSEGDVVLDDPKVSNPHCKFTYEDEQFIIWDFGSKNGTQVNGKKIRAATELKENDLIKIGDSTFVLKVLD